jgi:PAS domain S-box-containing protein
MMVSNNKPRFSPPDIIIRTRWYIYIRWFLLAAISLPGIISLYIVDGLSQQVQRDAKLGLIAISSNGIFYLISRLIKKPSNYKILAAFLISFDIFLVTLLIFINGGIESRNPVLYVIPMLLSSAIFGGIAIYKATFAVIAAYDFLIIADYLNIIHSIGAFDPTLRNWFSYVVNTVIFFSAVLIIIGLVIDYITRLLAEKEHQASDSIAALKHVQSIAKFGSWEWDINQDKVYWSEELCRIFGINSIDGSVDYGRYIKSLHPDDRNIANDAITKALKKKKSFSFDHRIIRPNGALRYVRGAGQPVLDETGRVVKLRGTAQDITEAKILEEARNDFVALASHQLRTPATGVKQYLGLLLEGYAGSLSDDQSSFVRIAYESNDRQLSIVDDLLNVVQVDSGNLKLRPAPVDMVKLLSNVVKDEAITFENKQQVLTFDTVYKSLVIGADERRIRMVVENILNNAHKYTPKKGHIKIKLTKSGNKNICISIADDGIGIAKKSIPDIFKKFTRINDPNVRKIEGTGLGLYIVNRIIKYHRGKVEVESKINKGTKFKIIIPINNSASK